MSLTTNGKFYLLFGPKRATTSGHPFILHPDGTNAVGSTRKRVVKETHEVLWT